MSAVVDFVSNAVEDVGNAVSDVASAVGDVVDTVVTDVGNVVQQAIDNPIQTIADIAAIATGNPELIPVINAGSVIANGGSLEDAAIAGGVSYIGGGIGNYVGSAVADATSSALAGSVAGGAAGGAFAGAATGQDPLAAAIGGGAIGGVVGSIYNNDGSVTRTQDDGSTITTHPDGSVTSTPSPYQPAPVFDYSTPYTPPASSQTPFQTYLNSLPNTSGVLVDANDGQTFVPNSNGTYNVSDAQGNHWVADTTGNAIQTQIQPTQVVDNSQTQIQPTQVVDNSQTQIQPTQVVDNSQSLGPINPGTTTPVSDTSGGMPTGPVAPVGPAQAPVDLVSTGISDSAPGTIYNGPNGPEIVLNSGKVVSYTDYQNAVNSGQPISIDGMMDTGAKVTVTSPSGQSLNTATTPSASNGYDQNYVDLVDSYQSNPTQQTAAALDAYLQGQGLGMTHNDYVTHPTVDPNAVPSNATGVVTPGGTSTEGVGALNPTTSTATNGAVISGSTGPVSPTDNTVLNAGTGGPAISGTNTANTTDNTAVTGGTNTTNTTNTSNNVVSVTNNDNVTTTTLANGTVTNAYTDGTVITQSPDGTTTTSHPDGTSTTIHPDGSVTNSGLTNTSVGSGTDTTGTGTNTTTGGTPGGVPGTVPSLGTVTVIGHPLVGPEVTPPIEFPPVTVIGKKIPDPVIVPPVVPPVTPPVTPPVEPPVTPPVEPPVPPVEPPPTPPAPPVTPPAPPVVPPVVIPPIIYPKTPTPTPPPTPPRIYPTNPVTPVDTGHYLNPGLMQTTPAYTTTNPTQQQFYWGTTPTQYQPSFSKDLFLSNPNIPAQPWNANTQLPRQLTPEEMAALVTNPAYQNYFATGPIAPTGS